MCSNNNDIATQHVNKYCRGTEDGGLDAAVGAIGLDAASGAALGAYTRSPLQDSRLLEPRPWKILATTYETNGFLSNPDPGENLVMENLVMETGCKD